MGLEAGLNIAGGLSLKRTSVNHGAAFDIAGAGVSGERCLIEAPRQAAGLAPK
jgi:4-hydroxy-L-threonine phosphate dehydrogenase PdxA